MSDLDDHREDAVKGGIKKLYALKKEYQESGGGITITQNTSEKTMSFIHNNPEAVSLIGTFAIYDQELLNEVQKQMTERQELLLVAYSETDEMKVYTVHLQEEDEEEEEEQKAKSGGCFIATAVYGSYDANQVRVLRKFRDERLQASTLGNGFVKLYYAVSPYIANFIASNKRVRSFVKKGLLDPIVCKLIKTDENNNNK